MRVCEIIDQAIQIHGATGISQWTPLARMYTSARTLRLADGPDEVHWHVVGRAELTRYEDDHASTVGPTATVTSQVFSGPLQVCVSAQTDTSVCALTESGWTGVRSAAMRHAVWNADGRLDVVDVEPPPLAAGLRPAGGGGLRDLRDGSAVLVRPPSPAGWHDTGARVRRHAARRARRHARSALVGLADGALRHV